MRLRLRGARDLCAMDGAANLRGAMPMGDHPKRGRCLARCDGTTAPRDLRLTAFVIPIKLERMNRSCRESRMCCGSFLFLPAGRSSNW